MEYIDSMCDPDRAVEADFARKLERERDILKKHISIMDISHKTANDEYFKLAAENEKLEHERDGWREAAYSLAEALPPSWEELQPPAEQLQKFKEMVAFRNKKTKEFLDNADKHSKMYP
jgi:hypothetical protein